MITTLNQNIVDVSYGIIIHVCNCRGAFNKGVAKDIRDKYPLVYATYYHHVKALSLGTILPVCVAPNLWVINMMAQLNYGIYNMPGNGHLDIDAFTACIQQVVTWNNDPIELIDSYGKLYNLSIPSYYTKDNILPIYAPYRIGCGNAGGSWDDVLHVLQQEMPTVTLCKLP